MGFTATGIQFDTVTNESTAGADDASQLAPLGFELTRESTVADEGMQTWIYVKANGNLTAGMVVSKGDGVTTYKDVIPAPNSSDPARVVGVVVNAIDDNGFGFLLRKGVCDVQAGASTGTGANLGCTVTTNGSDVGQAQKVAAVTGNSFGVTMTAATSGTVKAHINCEG